MAASEYGRSGQRLRRQSNNTNGLNGTATVTVTVTVPVALAQSCNCLPPVWGARQLLMTEHRHTPARSAEGSSVTENTSGTGLCRGRTGRQRATRRRSE